MSEGKMVLRARLHRSGNVDENHDAALPQASLAGTQPHELAGIAHRVTKHAPQIDPAAAARASPPIAAPSRGADGERAGKATQGVVLGCCSEVALREPLRTGRLGAHLARFLANDRPGSDASIQI